MTTKKLYFRRASLSYLAASGPKVAHRAGREYVEQKAIPELVARYSDPEERKKAMERVLQRHKKLMAFLAEM